MNNLFKAGAVGLLGITLAACQPELKPSPDLNDTNVSPEITSSPIKTALTRNPYQYTVTAVDEDEDDISFFDISIPSWLNFDRTTGLLSGTPSILDTGTYNVQIGYSDGTATLIHSFDITVEQSVNTLPVVTSTPGLIVEAEEQYSYQMLVTDADGDDITLSAITIPSWLKFNAKTGVLSGSASRKQIGTYNAVLGYEDPLNALQQSFSITVIDGYFLDPLIPPVDKLPANASDPSTYNLTRYGLGSISDTINFDSISCTVDHGFWAHSAGVVKPAVSGCTAEGAPIGLPKKYYPQVIGDALDLPTPTHKWWGSVSFHGEMKIGDPRSAAYITPDPISARISNVGARIASIPAGLGAGGNGYLYQVPDPFSEVFDGIAVANTDFKNLKAYVFDYSDGAVVVQWQDGSRPVMRATFVHGSPFVYFKAFRGELVVKTKAVDSGEKGIFYQQNDSLGVWTSVAGNRGDFLVVGEGETTFSNIGSNQITVSNDAKEMTIVLLPSNNGQNVALPTTSFFEEVARNVVARVDINYQVNRNTNEVTVTHDYLDSSGNLVDTVAGLHPMHWKNSNATLSGHKMRSARGVVQFSRLSSFDYTMPYVGVLPYLPSNLGAIDIDKLKGLIYQFLAVDSSEWLVHPGNGNTFNDTYWAGKIYGKVSELAAIAQSIGMEDEAAIFVDWLKDELSDWFTADTHGSLDVNKYFVYDEEWSTLLGMEESFYAHQNLNDHHFHYGYFVRAAAEICRQDITWCGSDQYGPMVELLIRDYAAGRDDDMFPYLRNFDPANGFSWASGNANFALGNNNESTSEAANSYGAIVLYGLITGNDELVEKGMYLHASTTTAYWEYWNNIDRFRNIGPDYDNFPSYYNRITTSIVWGHGSVFSTWFSGAFAHILGIQGLPSNTLSLHIGQYADYMADYVALGLEQSENNKPSGLVDDMWRDIWWNLWAMTDAEAAIADYNTMPVYDPEIGESKAHTYQWLHVWKQLGHMLTGTGEVTSNDPGALAFEKQGVVTYLAYNFSNAPRQIDFSDGHSFLAKPNAMTVSLSTDNVASDVTPPSKPGAIELAYVSQNNAEFTWGEAIDDNRVSQYRIVVKDTLDNIVQHKSSYFTQVSLNELSPATDYQVEVSALDMAGNESLVETLSFTTKAIDDVLSPRLKGLVGISGLGPVFVTLNWLPAELDNALSAYTVEITDGFSEVFNETTAETSLSLGGLSQGTEYTVSVTAKDTGNLISNTLTSHFSTTVNPYSVECTFVCVAETSASSLKVTVQNPNVEIQYSVNGIYKGGHAMQSAGASATFDINELSKGDKVSLFFVVFASGGTYNIDQKHYFVTGNF